MTLKSENTFGEEKNACKLAIIPLVTGYSRGMPEDLFNELLDNIDHFFYKVKC